MDEHENELVENSVVVSPEELAEEIHVQENGVEIADRIKSIGQKILVDELSRKTNQNKVRWYIMNHVPDDSLVLDIWVDFYTNLC